jgi:hypothetical protein
LIPTRPAKILQLGREGMNLHAELCAACTPALCCALAESLCMGDGRPPCFGACQEPTYRSVVSCLLAQYWRYANIKRQSFPVHWQKSYEVHPSFVWHGERKSAERFVAY